MKIIPYCWKNIIAKGTERKKISKSKWKYQIEIRETHQLRIVLKAF